jgi:uncharacterized protein YegP (UPF0339 family)
MKVVIVRGRNQFGRQRWHFRLIGRGGRVIAWSARYASLQECVDAANQVVDATRFEVIVEDH